MAQRMLSPVGHLSASFGMIPFSISTTRSTETLNVTRSASNACSWFIDPPRNQSLLGRQLSLGYKGKDDLRLFFPSGIREGHPRNPLFAKSILDVDLDGENAIT